MPRTKEELLTLSDDVATLELYTGTLVSYDGKGTSVMVGTPTGMDRIELCRIIQDVIAAQGDIPETTQVIGAPVAEALLGSHLLEDLGVPSAWLGFRPWGDGDTDGLRMPTTLHEFRRFIGRHIGLVPVAIGVMAIVFLAAFRSIPAVGLPLGEVGACLIAVFGLMGWLGVPVYLTIAVLPVILTAIGVADEIHIFTRYRDLLREHGDSEETDGAGDHISIVRAAMDEMWIPVVKTSITTAVGFLSFALSPIAPVQAFGVFTAVGIMFCMLWSLTVIPALLTVLGPARLGGRRRLGSTPKPAMGTRLFTWVGAAVLRHRYAAVAVAVLVVIAAPFGVRSIIIQDSWIDGFAPDSEFYRGTQLFNDQFLGTHILLAAVDTGGEVLTGEMHVGDFDNNDIKLSGDLVSDPESLVEQKIFIQVTDRPGEVGPKPKRRSTRDKWLAKIEAARREDDHVVVTTARRHGWAKPLLRLTGKETVQFEIAEQPLCKPDIIEHISKLEDFIEEHRAQAVGGVIGTADYIRITNFIARGRKKDARSIPENTERTHWLWSQYERIRGADRRRQIIDAHYSRSLVTVFLKNANFVDTQKLMDEIREYERRELWPHRIKLEFAGDVAVSQTLIGAIVSTQTTSLLVSLIGIVVITAVMGRAISWGFLCVLPCAIAVLINFAAMGWVGMPLGVATSMFAGMTLGIGVDYAIHLLERYRLSCSRGLGRDAAIADAVNATGPAILIDALGVALGFGILTLSQVPANARLGGLVMLSIVNCFAATIILLPALLRVFARQR
ncbi:MAG: efflux RND transporter permease subunit [Planctomycetota bacterium]